MSRKQKKTEKNEEFTKDMLENMIQFFNEHLREAYEKNDEETLVEWLDLYCNMLEKTNIRLTKECERLKKQLDDAIKKTNEIFFDYLKQFK